MSAHEIWMLTQVAVTTVAEAQGAYRLSVANVFLLFFIMLGPVKAIGPFYMATHELEPSALRALSWKVFTFAVVAVLLAGLLGSSMLRKWQISTPVMELAAGLVFLLVALQMVLAQYEPAPAPTSASAKPQLMHLVFPVTVTPYGIAAVITLMALSGSLERSLQILGLAVAVMALNLLAMLFVRPIMSGIGMVTLQILGAVLGILQVALALQIMHRALVALGYAGGAS
jgi:multiple antibiotic resistance protein